MHIEVRNLSFNAPRRGNPGPALNAVNTTCATCWTALRHPGPYRPVRPMDVKADYLSFNCRCRRRHLTQSARLARFSRLIFLRHLQPYVHARPMDVKDDYPSFNCRSRVEESRAVFRPGQRDLHRWPSPRSPAIHPRPTKGRQSRLSLVQLSMSQKPHPASSTEIHPLARADTTRPGIGSKAQAHIAPSSIRTTGYSSDNLSLRGAVSHLSSSHRWTSTPYAALPRGPVLHGAMFVRTPAWALARRSQHCLYRVSASLRNEPTRPLTDATRPADVRALQPAGHVRRRMSFEASWVTIVQPATAKLTPGARPSTRSPRRYCTGARPAP
ncbi:hypothetical protein CALCODRAFT_552569 [Calocera cornea HHB12733]|uniref:Uncharacterized protein n=1 Tax=Calocera cornea HHB12733 TaxID=1353952 RepID=A0A165K0T2_9BASI|nr:hypothetical protein CALCODRAFT_552569 [Calocera cornea HHB12733]